ncbi:hypothetical protein SLEP1_g47988 [Rubroshorea leprosula]|uniref:Uncharacterized protein n=1 Tax=Rubroshorea leprosula TaxID=152421 RepID=A0AAV5LU18_9ROSI|nr:hypothetical protein SLEP1_g47988 [Rubroshorea leprosula]
MAAVEQPSSVAVKFKAMLQLGSSRAAQLGSSSARQQNNSQARQQQSGPARCTKTVQLGSGKPQQYSGSTEARQPSSAAAKSMRSELQEHELRAAEFKSTSCRAHKHDAELGQDLLSC